MWVCLGAIVQPPQSKTLKNVKTGSRKDGGGQEALAGATSRHGWYKHASVLVVMVVH